MEKIFVLAGKARSGKDISADIIEKHYQNQKVIKYPCTLYLKKYASQISNWNENEEDKPRSLLQSLGKIIKEKYPDFFINRMGEDIDFLKNHADIIIVTGVRLQKELDFLRNKYNAILIKIEKPNLDNNLTKKEREDITEIDVDNYNNYDYIIENDGSVNNLKDKILEVI